MDDGERRERAGVLDPSRARRAITVGRAAPRAGLAALTDVVDYLWWVCWDAPEPHVQEVITRPVVHVVAEDKPGTGPRLWVVGVTQRRFDRVLSGRGRAVAAAFRPATFRPFLGGGDARGVGALRNREVPAGDVLGVDDRPLAAHLLDAGLDVEAAAQDLAAWLAERTPEPDPLAAHLAAVVERAETDASVTRAEHLADLAGVGLRTLQRRFGEYVGVGPKWTVQRFRLLDVAAAAHAGEPVDWARLAADLGYADQSHLIRAFTRLVGRPPATYARHA